MTTISIDHRENAKQVIALLTREERAPDFQTLWKTLDKAQRKSKILALLEKEDFSSHEQRRMMREVKVISRWYGAEVRREWSNQIFYAGRPHIQNVQEARMLLTRLKRCFSKMPQEMWSYLGDIYWRLERDDSGDARPRLRDLQRGLAPNPAALYAYFSAEINKWLDAITHASAAMEKSRKAAPNEDTKNVHGGREADNIAKAAICLLACSWWNIGGSRPTRKTVGGKSVGVFNTFVKEVLNPLYPLARNPMFREKTFDKQVSEVLRRKDPFSFSVSLSPSDMD